MRSITLCGFMGCGKTTVGKILAARTGREFLAAYVNPQARTWLSEMEIGEATFDSGYQNTDYLNADDVVYGSIPVEIGGRQCLFALQAASYGGRWYLLAARASLPDG